MSDDSSSIRKTLVKFNIDQASQKKLEKLIKDFERLEAALKLSAGNLSRNLESVKSLPAGISSEDRSKAVKNVGISRGEVGTLGRELETLGNKITAGTKGQLTDRSQRDEFNKHLKANMSEASLAFKESAKSTRQTTQSIRQMIAKDLERNPRLAKPNRYFSDKRATKMSDNELKEQLATSKARLNSAGRINSSNEFQDNPFLRVKSEAAVENIGKQFKQLNDENTRRQAFAKSDPINKQIKELQAENKASLRQKTSNALAGNDSARLGREALLMQRAGFGKGVQDKTGPELDKLSGNLKDYQKIVKSQVNSGNAGSGTKIRREVDAEVGRIGTQLQKVVAEKSARRDAEQGGVRERRAAAKFARDDRTTLEQATQSRLAKNSFARDGRAASRRSLNGVNSLELTPLKKQVKDYEKVIRQLVSNSSEGSKVWKEATSELKRIESSLEKIQVKKNTRTSQTEQGRARTNAARGLLAGSEKRNMDGGAGMFKQQAQLLKNYAVMGAGVGLISQSGQFMVQLEKEMKQLQSIVALTDTEMRSLSTTLVDVSEKTKFTALEVTQASVVLGQAGFGKDQIADSIKGITLFATAVGSTLKEAVDLATSTIGIFNRDARDMSNIADKLTTAVNSSKLNLNKLALGLQYAGNIAAQSNVSFEETVASLGAMANAGIRSGSTLGTGLRQILIALQKPSDEFRRTTQLLGIGMQDLDVSTNGLIPVLKKLSTSGFTVTDAMRTMQVRAAAAFGAFASNIDVADELAEKMEIGGSAARANAIQMESFANQSARLGSTFYSLVSEGLDPMLKQTTKLVSATADWLSGLKDVGSTLQLIGSIIVGGGIGFAISGLAKLVTGLVGGTSKIAGILGMGNGKNPDRKGGKMSGGRLRAAGRMGIGKVLFKLLFKKVTGILMVLGSIYGAFSYLNSRLDKDAQLKDKVDAAIANENAATSRQSASISSTKALNDAISNIAFKKGLLQDSEKLSTEIQGLNSKFKALGFYIENSVKDYDALFLKLQEFKGIESDKTDRATNEKAEAGVIAAEAIVKEQLATSGDNSSLAQFAKATRALLGDTGLVIPINPRSPDYTPPSVQRDPISNGPETDALFESSNTIKFWGEQFRDLKFTDESGKVDVEQVKLGNSIFDQLKSLEGKFIQKFSDPQALENLRDETGLDRRELKELSDAFMLELRNMQLGMSTATKKFEFRANNSPERIARKRETFDIVDQEIFTKDIPLITEIGKTFSDLRQNKQNPTDPENRDDVTAFEEGRKAYNDFTNRLEQRVDAVKKILEDSGLQGQDLIKAMRDTGITGIQNKALSENVRGFKGVTEAGEFTIRKNFQNELGEQKAKLAETTANLKEEADPAKSKALVDEGIAIQKVLSSLTRGFEDFVSILNEQGAQSKAIIANRTQQEVLLTQTKLNLTRDKTLFGQRLDKSLDGSNKNLDLDNQNYEDTQGIRIFKEFVRAGNAEVQSVSELSKAQVIAYEAQEEVFNARLAELQKVTTGGANYTNETKEAAFEEQQQVSLDLIKLKNKRAKTEVSLVETSIELQEINLQYLKDLVADNKQLQDGNDGKALTAIITKKQAAIDTLTKQLATAIKGQSDTGIENSKLTAETDTTGRDLKANQFDDDVRRRLFAAMTGTGFNPLGNETVDETYVPTNSKETPEGILENVKGGFKGINDLLMQSLDNFDPLTEAMKGLNDIAQSLAANFANAFTEFAKGTISAGDAFKQFSLGILNSMLEIAAEIAANALLKGLLQSFAGAGFGSLGLGGGPGASNASGVTTLWNGGEQFAGNYAEGGEITRGMPTRDSTFAKVAKGEFVLRRKAVQALGIDTVKALNSADPNLIDRQADKLGGNPTAESKDTGSKEVNVYVVSPDEMPASLGANDVVHIIADNLNRGGVTKQLVKRINMGML